MKISDRIPGITNQKQPENEAPLKPNKTPVRDQFEVFDSTRNSALGFPPIPDAVRNIADNRTELASGLGLVPKLPTPDQKEVKPVSRVDAYEGPDSISKPKIESKVDQYKGPKAVEKEPLIKSRTEKYKGPDSIRDSSLPPIPDAVSNILNNRTELASKIGRKPKD